jgi:hypothetical protein
MHCPWQILLYHYSDRLLCVHRSIIVQVGKLNILITENLISCNFKSPKRRYKLHSSWYFLRFFLFPVCSSIQTSGDNILQVRMPLFFITGRGGWAPQCLWIGRSPSGGSSRRSSRKLLDLHNLYPKLMYNSEDSSTCGAFLYYLTNIFKNKNTFRSAHVLSYPFI